MWTAAASRWLASGVVCPLGGIWLVWAYHLLIPSIPSWCYLTFLLSASYLPLPFPSSSPPPFFLSSFFSLPVFLDFETGYHVAHPDCLQTHYVAEDVFELIILLLSTFDFSSSGLFLEFLSLLNQKYWFVCFSEHFSLESWNFSILWWIILIVSLIQPGVTWKKWPLKILAGEVYLDYVKWEGDPPWM